MKTHTLNFFSNSLSSGKKEILVANPESTILPSSVEKNISYSSRSRFSKSFVDTKVIDAIYLWNLSYKYCSKRKYSARFKFVTIHILLLPFRIECSFKLLLK